MAAPCVSEAVPAMTARSSYLKELVAESLRASEEGQGREGWGGGGIWGGGGERGSARVRARMEKSAR